MSGLPSGASNAFSSPSEYGPHHALLGPGGGANFPKISAPSIGPGGATTHAEHYQHASDAFADANGTINYTFHVTLEDSHPSDCGQFQPMFVSQHPTGSAKFSTQRSFGLPIMNRMLGKRAFKQKYCRLPLNARNFFEDWELAGYRRTKDHNPDAVRHSSNINVCVAKEMTNIPNIWGATRSGYYCYILARFEKVPDELEQMFGPATMRKKQRVNEHADEVSRVIFTQQQEEELKHKDRQGFKLRLFPFLSRCQNDPPPRAYEDMKDRSVGDFRYIGRIHKIEGNRSGGGATDFAQTTESVIDDAINPKQDGPKYLDYYVGGQLSRLKMQLGVL